MKCFLQSLSDHRVAGRLEGLKVENGSLLLEKDKFGCCDGTGMAFAGPGELARKCHLRTRLQLASDFLADFLQHRSLDDAGTYSPGLVDILPADEAQLRQWQYSDETGAWSQASDTDWQRLLSVGLAASWNYGLEAHIFAPHFPHSQLNAAMRFRHARSGQLMLIWGVRPLVDQHRLGELEQVLNHATKAGMKIWIFAEPSAVAPSLKSGRMRMPRSYRAGISAVDLNTGEWLNGRTKSLLEEIFGARTAEFLKFLKNETPVDSQRNSLR
jgi:hypothetical protein